MTKLVAIFRSYITKCGEGEAGSKYKASNLKKRLQKSHPQLVFHPPSRRNRSEFVFVEDLSAGLLAEHFDWSEEDSSDDEEECYSCNFNVTAALILKNIIKDVPIFHTTWPPTADHFNKDVIFRTVPPELFDFLCWLIGQSDEPSSECLRGSFGESYECKVDAIAQDLIYLSSKGQKQTPKSLSLGLLVRQLMGSAELISVLNYFGHCASYDTVMSPATRDMIKRQPTVLVFDNQDYNEETKSGKGQTHCIAVQRLQSQPNKSNPTENVSKRKRSLTLNEEGLPTHYLGKKQSLHVYHLSQYIHTDIEVHSDPQKFHRKHDRAFVLCKLHYEGMATELPGWTGFNTLLHSDVPAMSTISYLSIIDNPVTEFSPINDILYQCVTIADELELTVVVLVADEAVYAKLQQVR